MPDLFRLDERVVAVIGAGSGIGEAIARGAASQGARHVACLDVNAEQAERVATDLQAIGGGSGHDAVDIADETGGRTGLLDDAQRALIHVDHRDAHGAGADVDGADALGGGSPAALRPFVIEVRRGQAHSSFRGSRFP